MGHFPDLLTIAEILQALEFTIVVAMRMRTTTIATTMRMIKIQIKMSQNRLLLN